MEIEKIKYKIILRLSIKKKFLLVEAAIYSFVNHPL